MDRFLQSAKVIDSTAAAWVARRDAGLNSAEAADLELWRAADPRHHEALARYEGVWAAASRPRHTGAAKELGAEIAGAARQQRRRRVRRAAAVGVVSLLMLAGIWQLRSLKPPSVPTSRAIVLLPQQQTLPDGSRVEYPIGSEIIVDFGGQFRRVTLTKGEAHFQVVKDAARPFIVEAGGFQFRAVGTAFDVQLGPKVQVLVTEGRIAVEQPARKDPGDRGSAAGAGSQPESAPHTLAHVDAGHLLEINDASAAATGPAEPVAVASLEIARRLAWRNPRVEFSTTPLSEVLQIVNRYNRVQFVIVDSALATVPLSGLFRADDPETLQHLLGSGFGIAAERRGDEIRLKAAAVKKPR